jgi:hypothetical protein
VLALDAIGFYRQVLYSRFLYFVFPKKIIKLKRQREQLVQEIKLYTNKYIGIVDEKYNMERVFNIESEIDEGDTLIRKNPQRKKKKHIIEEIDKFYLNINLIQGDNTN